MNGLVENTRSIFIRERALKLLYSRLNNRIRVKELKGKTEQLKNIQNEQIELLSGLIEKLKESGEILSNQERPIYSQYIVQPGDTLFFIAQKYNTNVTSLLRVNPEIEDPDKIQSGMVINLPNILAELPECYEEYTVQSGDTLFKLAKKFDTTINELIIFNNISNPDFIFSGRILIIPCPENSSKDSGTKGTSENLVFDTLIRKKMNFEIPTEDRFFAVNTRRELRKVLNEFEISVPEGIDFNSNIVIGGIEYNIQDLELENRTIRAVVNQQRGRYHLIAVPKNQFPALAYYRMNFVTSTGNPLAQERMRINF